MDKHKILGIGLPTNEPETAFEYVLPSLNHMTDVVDYCTFLVNFQPPWTEDQINRAVSIIEGHGFEVRYALNHYKIDRPGHIPIGRIRHDASNLMPDAKFYALIDDDMRFLGPTDAVNESAGRQYLRMIHYLLAHPRCGMIIVGGSLVRSTPKYAISPTHLVSPYLVNKGFVCRNMSPDGLIIPYDALSLVGANEDRLMAAFVLSKGLYPARVSHGKAYHSEFHHKKQVISGAEQYKWNHDEIVEQNSHKYIREHFNPHYDASKFRGHGVIDPAIYLSNGGSEITPVFCMSNTTYYEGITNDDLKQMIDKLVEY